MAAQLFLPPRFGANVDPSAGDPRSPFRRAQLADEHGLDLIGVQDHPYNSGFLETWTLLAALGATTQRVHLLTNVLNTPLRLPAMIAKQAATLDLLTGGRLDLGLGAGAFAQGIASYGGAAREPAEALAAFEDTLQIVRGMLDSAGRSFSYEGRIHQVRGAHPGPAPAHRIPIWTGSNRPRGLRLTGRLADGVLLSSTYVPFDQLLENNRLIDEGAAQAERPTTAIRRGYNLMGVLGLGQPDTRLDQPQPGQIVGPAQHWVETIVRLYRDYRQDTFFFWSVAGNELLQIEAFAREVAPAARAAIAGLGLPVEKLEIRD
jgi:alkanesulfonate monooxygenase SsuD/methylene tetrahydromethanopterin reductase-like flavin-dependent oxidoreductase (luciferase family)